jgi:hypothetical protein
MSADSEQFNAAELIARAVAQTGFDDFGDLPLGDGLDVLLQTYDRHVLDPAGRKRCADRVVNLLATRLRCEDAFKRVEGLEEQIIEPPVFVTGLPRSGTSALINLLSKAEENRALLQWEIHFPDPWRGSAPGDQDPRYAPLKKAMEGMQDSAFRKIHYVDADTPEECVMLHALAFTGVQLGFEIQLEPYRSWLLAQDLRPMYAYQKRLLQLLNWRNRGQRWMLKAPAHMLALDAISEVFPGARFVWCHRDPQAVVPSINSMNKVVMAMYAGDCSHLDSHELAHKVMDWYAMSLSKGLKMREQMPADLFVDCSQQELVEQPMAVVERMHKAFGLPLADTSRAAMQAHVDANPKGKYGRHEYDLASWGLSKEVIAERFAFYTGDTRWPVSE